MPALHAAVLEDRLFQSVEIRNMLVSWSNVIEIGIKTDNQLVTAVHAGLTQYDLPDLAAALGSKITLLEPMDAKGCVIN